MRSIFKNIIVAVLTWEAKLVINRHRPFIVAVTGSVGKTSTKDAIYEVVKQGTHARKSEKSFNSELGLPLTIIGVPNAWSNPLRWIQNIVEGLLILLSNKPYPRVLVLEVGADRPGDIKKVSKWLPVDIAVITRLPEMPVHVEFFSSPQAVVEEKAALIDALKPEGILVLYADDARAEDFKHRAEKKNKNIKVFTFGLGTNAEVRAEDMSILYTEGDSPKPAGMKALLAAGESRVPFEVFDTIGEHMLLPLLAAAAVGFALDKNISEVASALAAYKPPAGRMHIISGIKGSLIIDDTYNSSPAAVVAGLDTLGRAPQSDRPGRAPLGGGISPGRRIAVLADMLELGKHSAQEHKKVGDYAAKTVDLLVTVGFRARDIAQGALDAGMNEQNILQFETAEKAGDELAALLKEGDIVLVKGSQSMRMEKAVEALMADPERAKELLVRQDEEWRRR